MTLTDATLAHQRETERRFAACAFADPVNALRRCGWLKPEMIADEAVRRFWQALNNGSGGDPAKAAAEAGMLAELLGWMVDQPSLLYAEQYANEIRNCRYLVSTDDQIGQLLRARQTGDIPEMRRLIHALASSAPVQVEKIPDAVDVALEFSEWLETPQKAILTHLTPFDRALEGLDYQTISILAGRPSMGKSTLAAQIARNVARSLKVIVFTNEMSRLAWWRKAACGSLGMDYRDIKGGRLTEEQRDELVTESMRLAESYGDRLLIDDRASHTSESIWQIVAAEQPALVIVDILANLKDRHDREVLRLRNMIYTLRDLAKENHCHVMTLHHVNRNNEARENKVPTMSDLRESGDLEQAADYVIFLHSDEYYQLDVKPTEQMTTHLIVAKNREGPRSIDVEMMFDLKRQWFARLP